LAKLGITVPEIVSAIQAQNTVNPAGQVGGSPAPPGQEFTYSVRAQGPSDLAEEFGDIVVRELPDGGIVRVRDVARIELGRRTTHSRAASTASQGAIIAVYQLPGSNAVDAAKGVRS
jgi:HAE1 family hydrophobic/amphiphilic exporter-1